MSVCDIFGLYCSDVLFSFSFLSDLCSVLYWFVLIGYSFVNICGFIFLKFGSGLVVVLVVCVMVLLIFVVVSFLMLVMMKFICLVDSDLRLCDFGVNMLMCLIGYCVLVVIILILFFGCSVLLMICMSIMMLM